MSKNLRKCLENMCLINNTNSSKLKKSLLKEISCQDCYFKAIHEIAWNIYKNKLTLTAVEKKKLRSHIKLIEKILLKPKSVSRRALVVRQSGGFLNIAIPAVVTALSEILRHVIS